jgi:hypothetical protein
MPNPSPVLADRLTDYQEFQERGGNRVDVFRYQPGVSYSLSLSAAF